jgi:hypothetical protein
MKIYKIVSIPAFVIIAAFLAYGCQQQDIIRASVSEIKNNPLKYEGKIVRVVGYLESGHAGVGLESEDRKDRIRLRSPNVVDTPVPVQRDALFEQFWTINTEIHKNDPDWKDIEVEIDGFVRVLKENGKVAKEFDLYGQWPIEVITTHIIRISNVK